jgi:hypothetical protein
MEFYMDGTGYCKQDAFCCKGVEDIRAHACGCGYPDGGDDRSHVHGNKILAQSVYNDFFENISEIWGQMSGDVYPRNNSNDARSCNYPPRTGFQI